LFDTFFMT